MSGRFFGRLEAVDRLGTGSFATVWRCRDPELGGEVAVKVLAENHAADERTRTRFVEEAQLLRRTDGQGRIVAVHDVGRTEDGRPYMVMEYAPGGTLAERLSDEALPLEAVAQLVKALRACLGVLHANGIVHRDLKPSNLLVSSQPATGDGGPLLRADERLVVGDLGLAKAAESDWEGTVLGGTPAYMAPEQQHVGRIDTRADLYAAAAIVARAASGTRPKPAAAGVDPVPPLASPYPPEFRSALARCMAYDAEERPGDAAEWAEILLDGLHGRGPSARPSRPPWLHPIPVAIALGVAVLMATVAFLASGGGGGEVLALSGDARVGEQVEVRASGVEVSSWRVEPADATSLEASASGVPTFAVRPVFPRPLTVMASTRGGEEHRLVLLPEPSPDAPLVSGPETIGLREPADFSVTSPCEDVRWVVETAEGFLNPGTGCRYGFNADRAGKVFVLASRTVTGREVGTAFAVDIVGD